MGSRRNKGKDMARGALASSRGAQTDRRAIHQQERASERAWLRALRLAGADGTDEIVERRTHQPAISPTLTKGRIAWMVDDRRCGDHLGPLFRWAERRIESDRRLGVASNDEIRVALARQLGNDAAGRHALGHLDCRLDLSR